MASPRRDGGIIIALTPWAAKKYGRLNHPTYLAVGVNLFNLLFEPPRRREWLQGVLRAVIQG